MAMLSGVGKGCLCGCEYALCVTHCMGVRFIEICTPNAKEDHWGGRERVGLSNQAEALLCGFLNA